MNEDMLLPFFEEFGSILELTVIRDKSSKVHRGTSMNKIYISITTFTIGCAFLTYARRASAIRAIDTLHDKIKLQNVCLYYLF